MKQSVPHLRWFWDAFVRRHRLPPDGFIARGLVLWECLLSYDPRIRFDIEQWDDLKPAVHYWRQTLRKGFSAVRDVLGIRLVAGGGSHGQVGKKPRLWS
jgi:hypothetical protein